MAYDSIFDFIAERAILSCLTVLLIPDRASVYIGILRAHAVTLLCTEVT